MPRPVLAVVRCCLLVALACAAAVIRAAEKADITDFSLEELVQLEVVSASKVAQKASDAPASVTVLTAQDFRDYGWRTVADALRTVRGMYVTYDRSYSYLGVRGFGPPLDYNSRILILIDGYRINDNVYDQGYIGTELNLDVDLIDRIEIVRGPSSSVYGSSAFFGVVNVITRSAAQQRGIEVAVSAGSFDSHTGRVTYARTGEETALLLSATGYHAGSEAVRFPGTGLTTRGTDYLHDGELFAKLNVGHWAMEILYGDRTKGVPGGQFGSVFDDRRNALEDSLTIVGMTYDRKVGSVDVSGRLTYGHYVYRGDLVYGAPGYSTPTMTQDFGQGTWWTGEIKGVFSPFAGHRMVAGLEYQDSPQQDQSSRDPFTTFVSVRRDSSRYGLYVQDDYNLTPAVILSGGLRYDAFSNYDSALNPRLGLIWKQDAATVWKLLYGSAFRAPNAYETYYSFPAVAIANTQLRPENIDTYEAVVEHQLSERARIVAALYHNRINRLIGAVDAGGGITQYRNMGSVHANGVELEGEMNFRGGARLRASYVLQVVKDDAGMTLSNSPRHVAAINASVPLFDTRWRLGFESQYLSGRTTDLSRIDAYAVANLTLSSQELVKGLYVSASVYNLFNHTYYDPVDLDDVHDLMPQPGRAVQLKAIYRF